MQSLVSVTSTALQIPTRRDVLLFDRIGLLDLERRIADLSERDRADVEWLIDADVAFSARFDEPRIGDLADDLAREELRQLAFDFLTSSAIRMIAEDHQLIARACSPSDMRSRIIDTPFASVVDVDGVVAAAHRALQIHLSVVPVEDFEQLFNDAWAVTEARLTIMYARRLALLEGVASTVSLPEDLWPSAGPGQRPHAVLDVAIKALPVLDEATPWSAVLEFRRNPDVQVTLRRFRRWLNTVGASFSSQGELEQELEHLLDEYESHMRLHRLRYEYSTIHAIVTAFAAVLDGLARLNFVAATNAIFSVRERKLALYDAELSTPGRDLAYISRARHTLFKTGGA